MRTTEFIVTCKESGTTEIFETDSEAGRKKIEYYAERIEISPDQLRERLAQGHRMQTCFSWIESEAAWVKRVAELNEA